MKIKLANGMLIIAFSIAGSDSQSPETIKVTPNESPKISLLTQNIKTKRYLKVTSKSEKTSDSGKSSRTTSNSAKSSKSERRKPNAPKKPTDFPS